MIFCGVLCTCTGNETEKNHVVQHRQRLSSLTSHHPPFPLFIRCFPPPNHQSLNNPRKPRLISRERQRERERRLEARIVESEEARIEVEAEAGRLQAFLDEMRGLGPLFVQPRRGGANEGAAE